MSCRQVVYEPARYFAEYQPHSCSLPTALRARERVGTHIIEATRWPAWYPNSKDVEIQHGDPVLRDGTVFRWTTFGLAIESKVHEYVVNQRLGWYGYAPGAKPSFYHSWYLEPRGAM